MIHSTLFLISFSLLLQIILLVSYLVAFEISQIVFVWREYENHYFYVKKWSTDIHISTFQYSEKASECGVLKVCSKGTFSSKHISSVAKVHIHWMHQYRVLLSATRNRRVSSVGVYRLIVEVYIKLFIFHHTRHPIHLFGESLRESQQE